MKNFEEKTSIKLKTIVKKTRVSIPIFKEDKPNNWKNALAADQRESFYSSLDKSEWHYLNNPSPKKNYVTDEVFGRTNLVHKIIDFIEDGFTDDEICDMIQPFLVRNYLPKGKIRVDGREYTINGYLSVMIQNGGSHNIRDFEWDEQFKNDYLNKYTSTVKKLESLM